LPGEMEFREWLVEHATEVLIQVGIRKGQIVLDYGCGPGIFTIPRTKIVVIREECMLSKLAPTSLKMLKRKRKRLS
jgi:ubiquinone/menaquinone biosynthesis C-methylase UbiE